LVHVLDGLHAKIVDPFAGREECKKTGVWPDATEFWAPKVTRDIHRESCLRLWAVFRPLRVRQKAWQRFVFFILLSKIDHIQ
jgi:hypothetical protein